MTITSYDMIKCIVMLLFALLGGSAENTTLPDCLTNLVGTFPRIIYKAAVFTGDIPFLTDVLLRLEVPVMVNAVEHPKRMDTRRGSDLVVVMGDVGVSHVLKNVLWGRDTLFVVLRETGSDPEVDLREMWRVKAVNGYVAVEDPDGVVVYGNEPYLDCKEATAMLLGECIGFKTGYKAVRDMNGCLVNISVVDIHPSVILPKVDTNIEGIEGEYMKVIATTLNFTGRYREPIDGFRWGSVDPPRGLVGDLMKRDSEFGVGLFRPVSDRYENVDLSNPMYEKECVTFFVPVGVGRDSLNWLRIIISHFTIAEWCLILVSFLSVTALLCVSLSPVTAFMSTLSSLLGQSFTPAKKPVLRYLTHVWIVFSFIITSIYQGSWGSKITVPLSLSNIETLRQLIDSDLTLTGHENVMEAVARVTDDAVLPVLRKRFVPSSKVGNEALMRVVQEGDSATAQPTSIFTYLILNNPEAKGKVLHLKECLYAYTPVVGMQRNSPFTPTINELLLKLSESGIGNFWRSNFLRSLPSTSPGFTSVNLRRSLGVFAILLSGLLISAVAFVCELWIGSKRFRC